MPKRSPIAMGAACLIALCTVPARASAPSQDPHQPRQWSLSAVGAVDAWKTSQGKGATIALIASGVDTKHPDLRGRLRLGPDLVHPGATIVDSGMGTYYASLIAAARNGVGIAGVAPQSSLLVVKATDAGASFSGLGATAMSANPDVAAAAVRYATSHGAKVIVLVAAPHALEDTLGGVDAFALLEGDLEVAIWQAALRGVAVVVPAGDNAERSCPPYLRALPQVLCVGAVDRRLNHTGYSAVDVEQEQQLVVAPGGSGAGYYADDIAREFVPVDHTDEDVVGDEQTGGSGDIDEDGVISYASTRVAAAHVAGVLGLLIARGYSPTAAVSRVLKTARDLGPPGRDAVYGFGLVDAAAAVR